MSLALSYYIAIAEGALNVIIAKPEDYIAGICNMVYEQHKIFFGHHQLDYGDLELYAPVDLKVDPEKDLFERVETSIRSQSPLKLRNTVHEALRLGENELDPSLIHFVVAVRPDAVPRPVTTELDAVPGQGVKRKRNALGEQIALEKECLAKISKHTPSSLSFPATFKTNSKDIVCCNRPFDFHIPIALLQEEFGKFKDDCERSPSPKAQELLLELTEVACKWHDKENTRREGVQMAFSEKAGLYLVAESIYVTEYAMDGNLKPNIMPSAIWECKNECGCPLFQAIAYYVQFLVKKLAFRGTRFPCILITNMGPYLGLYGCLWTGEKLLVEPLVPMWDLTTHWTDEAGRGAIASSLDAFLKAVGHLETHYKNVPNSPSQDRTYPYKTCYEDETSGRVNFKYQSQLDKKLVFTATNTSDDKDRLCIKFTRRYSETAHRFLAGLGHAPRLRAITKLPGGWIMVVMDCSSYTPLDDPKLVLSDQTWQKVKSKVGDIVQKLHDNGLVHGDIREVNTLVDPASLASEDDCAIHIIDFDWAGKIGEVTYPMRINTTSVQRPDGVSDGQPITVEHDKAMVQYFS